MVTHHDLFDHQSCDALPFGDMQLASIGPQTLQEARQRLGEHQVPSIIVQLRCKALQVALKAAFALAQLWQTLAKLIERE